MKCFLKFPLTKPVERQIPYTLFGLARAAHVPLEMLLDAYRKPRRNARDRILFDAVLRVAAYTQERAMLGELTYQVALEALRLIEGAAQEDGGEATLRVLMEEPVARYAT